MMMRSAHRWPLLAAFAVLLVGSLLAVSCGDDGGSGGGDGEVINAINILDKAGLHGIDDSINTDKTVPASARATAQQLQAVTKLTEWPTDALQKEADALAAIFGDLATATAADADIAKAGEAATKAHDAEHDFSHEVWAYLYKEAGVDTGGDSHE